METSAGLTRHRVVPIFRRMGEDKRRRWSNVTFMTAFGACLLVVAWISAGYLVPLVIAASGAVLLGPWNERLTRRLGGRRGISALVMTFASTVVLLVPMTLIVIALVRAAIPLINQVGTSVAQGDILSLSRDLLPERLYQALSRLPLGRFQEEIGNALAGLTGGLAAFATSLPVTATNLMVDGFIVLVGLYSFFLHGPKLVHQIVEATPMERPYTLHLLTTIGVGIRTIFAASFITAAIQLVLGYVAFRIVDLPYALGLAALMAFFSFVFSLVPVLGSGLVWVPAAATLMLSGRLWAGLFLVGWGVFVLGSVDNLVKPLYAKGRMRLSPLVIFVTLFGGISAFGPIGALVGPIFAALAAAFLHIWTTDFLSDVHPIPEYTPARPKLSRLVGLGRRRRQARDRNEHRPPPPGGLSRGIDEGGPSKPAGG